MAENLLDDKFWDIVRTNKLERFVWREFSNKRTIQAPYGNGYHSPYATNFIGDLRASSRPQLPLSRSSRPAASSRSTPPQRHPPRVVDRASPFRHPARKRRPRPGGRIRLAGKTTVARILLRLIEPTRGLVLFEGQVPPARLIRAGCARYAGRSRSSFPRTPTPRSTPRILTGSAQILAEPFQESHREPQCGKGRPNGLPRTACARSASDGLPALSPAIPSTSLAGGPAPAHQTSPARPSPAAPPLSRPSTRPVQLLDGLGRARRSSNLLPADLQRHPGPHLISSISALHAARPLSMRTVGRRDATARARPPVELGRLPPQGPATPPRKTRYNPAQIRPVTPELSVRPLTRGDPLDRFLSPTPLQ